MKRNKLIVLLEALIFLLALCTSLMCGSCTTQKLRLGKGEVVHHKLDQRVFLILSGPHKYVYGTYYIARFIDDEGEFQAMVLEEKEIIRKGDKE